jgi:hypothetical protein
LNGTKKISFLNQMIQLDVHKILLNQFFYSNILHEDWANVIHFDLLSGQVYVNRNNFHSQF